MRQRNFHFTTLLAGVACSSPYTEIDYFVRGLVEPGFIRKCFFSQVQWIQNHTVTSLFRIRGGLSADSGPGKAFCLNTDDGSASGSIILALPSLYKSCIFPILHSPFENIYYTIHVHIVPHSHTNTNKRKIC
jgi:hypothetical protein